MIDAPLSRIEADAAFPPFGAGVATARQVRYTVRFQQVLALSRSD
jgi:hypothetical protein